MQLDPRTVARNIPGIFNEIFPQLTPSIVAYFNSQAVSIRVEPIPPDLLHASKLQRAMLFELGYSAGEELLKKGIIDWESCFSTTLERQLAFYDANLPEDLVDQDKAVAEIVGRNLMTSLREISDTHRQPILFKPTIPGLEWISTGWGDFSIGTSLIEVKCANHNFSAADYRQVGIYWLLSYAASIEGRGKEWEQFALLNPRLGFNVSLRFDDFLAVVSSGRAKVDILQLFISLVGSRITR